MLTFCCTSGSSSLENVIATQSPTFERITNGSGALAPEVASSMIWSLSWLRTKTSPFGSVSRVVSLTGTLIAVTLYGRTGAVDGQRPSGRFAEAVLPRYGVPVWPAGVNGGRMPRCGRIIG